MKYTKHILPLLLGGWIVFLVFLNFSPFLVGLSLTPTWSVFLGTVFYSMDYLYYLTFMVQGETHWFFSSHLQTGEILPQSIIGWPYIVMGKISYLLHISPIVGFQIAIIIFSFLFLLLSYRILDKIFSSNKLKAFLAFLLFTTANSLPLIIKQKNTWSFDVYHPWYNWGQPFTRFSNIPHHLLIQCAILTCCLLFTSWLQHKSNQIISRKNILYYLGFILIGFVLGSTQPVQLGLIVGGISILQLFTLRRKSKQDIILHFLPLVCIALGAIAPMIHLQQTSKIPLYALAASWEGNQHMPNSIQEYIRLNGMIVITALLGLFFAWKKQGALGKLLFIITCFSLSIFFSTLPQRFHISNVRFLSSIPTLYFSISTMFLFVTIAERIKKIKLVIILVLTLLLILPTLPASITQAKQRTSEFITNNAYQYLHILVYKTFMYAKQISTEDDVFLVTWPLNLAFPAVTGRRSFYTNFLATEDFDRKEWLTGNFFSGNLSIEEAKNMFETYHIKYIIGVVPEKYSSLPIHTLNVNAATAIYEVR